MSIKYHQNRIGNEYGADRKLTDNWNPSTDYGNEYTKVYIRINVSNYDCAAGYMAWNSENWEQSKYIDDEQKERCRENLKVIGKIAELMTTEEAEDFINCIYEEEPKPF